MSKVKYLLIILAVVVGIFLIKPISASAGLCQTGRIYDPFTDLDWAGIFPIRVGGVPVVPGIPDVEDYLPPVCTCTVPIPRVGITFSFWNPGKLDEVVQQPFCFQAFGVQLSNPAGAFLGGHISSKTYHYAGYQAHYYDFPIFAVLDLFTDAACIQSPVGGVISIPIITEVLPTWQDGILADFMSPETILFANPIAQLACIPDALSSQIYAPLDPLFWCMGSWGGVFPLDGNTGGTKDSVEGAAAIGGKNLFMAYQFGDQWGSTGVLAVEGVCQAYPDPIWLKSSERFDLSMPIPEPVLQPIGQTSLVWSMLKDPPAFGGNYVFTLFHKHDCCAL